STSASNTPNITAFAPMPSAIDSTAVAVKAGERRSSRSEWRRSRKKSSIHPVRRASRQASSAASLDPKRSRASRLPPSRSSCSRCNSISRFSSASARPRRNNERSRSLATRWILMSLGSFDHRLHRARKPAPTAQFALQLPLSIARERINLRRPPQLRIAPGGRDPPLLLQTMQGGIERPLPHRQHVLRAHQQPLGDSPAMARPRGEDAQDQQVQGSFQQVERLRHDRASNIDNHASTPDNSQDRTLISS